MVRSCGKSCSNLQVRDTQSKSVELVHLKAQKNYELVHSAAQEELLVLDVEEN